ncbi:HXXEE domain-containing protein [Paenibacillus dakarensis]|uniref:HXXEE domain-containing protein n=1 Tax=Paenibacillus dakarensis TaxID=1527293 RepID=UPI0006D56ED0|nr:HXXEE domain-containing protein [Paenibacillus dakarensis]
MSIQTLIWLFIVAFMLHDLEEIIWVETWLKKHKDDVIHKVPNRMKKSLEKMFDITSGQFAFAVLLEFIVFIPFTYLAAEHEVYFYFLSFNTLFFLHVFAHLGQSLYLKRYTPGVVTAVLCVLPYTLYMYNRMLSEELVSWSEVLLSIPAGLLMIPIVLLGHELGKKLVR